MKFIYIVLSGLGQLFRKNKPVFALFIIGSISASLMFSYFYGNMLTFMQTSVDDSDKTCVVKCSDFNIMEEAVTKLSNDERISNIHVSSDITEDERLSVTADLRSDIFDMESLSGRYFTEEEIESAAQVAIGTVYGNGVGADIGEILTINGYDFECIGKHARRSVVVPFSTYMALGFGDESGNVIVIYLKSLEVSNSKEFKDEMESLFKDAGKVVSGYEYQQNVKSFAKSELLIYVCPFYAVSMLAFMFLLKYLIDETADEMVVYSVCGASKTTVSVMLFWEIAILSLTTGVVGALLHKLLYRSVFDKLNVVPGIRYRFIDYAVICLSMLVISMLVSLPFIASFRKLSLIDSKRKCDV